LIATKISFQKETEPKGELMDQFVDKIKDFAQAIGNWCLVHIKGLGALIIGITLMYLCGKVILSLLVFVAGGILTYYGFAELKVTPITKIIDNCISYLKKSCSCK
jgi:hypothetical protein